MVSSSTVERTFPFPFIYTGEELAAHDTPPLKFVIDGLLPEGMTILAGTPKFGKSWLALQLAQAASTGGEIFGVKVPMMGVLYLALEDGERRIKERTEQLGWDTRKGPVVFAFEWDFPDDDSGPMEVWLEREKAKIWRPDQADQDKIKRRVSYLMEFIEVLKPGIGLVIIDTLSIFAGHRSWDQSNPSHTTEVLKPLQTMAQQNRIGILVIDHHNKMSNYENPNVRGDLLGSTAKAAVADTLVGLYRKPNRPDLPAKLVVTGRDIEDQVLLLTQNPDSAGWDYAGDGSYPAQQKSAAEELYQTLKDHGEQVTSDLALLLGRNLANVRQDLLKLERRGLVRSRRGRGKTVYWSAVKEEEEDNNKAA